MTDTTTEPVAHPATTAPPPEPPSPPSEQAQAPTVGRELAHTPGGIPVLPLTLAGTNGAVGAVSTAALVGGGPVALAVAAGGAAVAGATAAVRAHRRNRTTTANGGRSTSANRQGGTNRRSTRTPSSGSRGSSGLLSGGRGRSTKNTKGAKTRTGAGSLGLRSGGGSAGRSGGRHGAPGTSRAGTGGRGAGRLGQVRALRSNNRAQTPTRSSARQQTTAARRAVADARRDARAATRANKTAAGSRGLLKRAGSWAAGKAAAGSRALVNKARAARDRATGAQVTAKRERVRKAPARRKARFGLLKSAARFQGRRLLAALAGTAAGVLGCLTTPLGKKLGWSWLVHPGRRLYQRLLLSAREKRAARDEQIRATRTAEEAAADAAAAGDTDVIGDRVERPAHLIPTAPAASEVIHVSGFKFEEAAAEMESAARQYEPDGNMEVLAMIDNLPTAMQSIANTFRILAERSDEEFAFEKDVAAAFDDIHRTLLNAVDDADTLVPLFRNVHEHDIARHEDPRNGTEAEKGWNV
ncbi:hypothetical protein GCM10022403_039090 [Streptomyces coacervatus]|uniref:Uncharacterized protein n=1 Tax=Streptomyces coacervatus TaxID=647381 RepID=A0ABP7HP91_9ACTN|nr:hypothetical protein [Streptomyces coacervatus]MDF2270684.1 hypothetical protein [Streptomyces coacervatus]